MDPTTTQEPQKTRTITMTGRPPVRIVEAEWPVIASVNWHDGQVESQANRTATIRVRRHENGRHLVYGVATSNWRGEEDGKAGMLVEAPMLIEAIRTVAADIGHAELAQRLIAELPAEDL